MNVGKEAVLNITPAGLLDICKAFGFEMYTKDGSENIGSYARAEELEHNNCNRQEIVDMVSVDADVSWEDVRDYLDI